MERFLVTSTHTAEDCRHAINHFLQYHAGFLTHFEWGCYDNDHNAYAIIEAENHDAARLAVPPLFREKTKVVKLVHIKPSATDDPKHM